MSNFSIKRWYFLYYNDEGYFKQYLFGQMSPFLKEITMRIAYKNDPAQKDLQILKSLKEIVSFESKVVCFWSQQIWHFYCFSRFSFFDLNSFDQLLKSFLEERFLDQTVIETRSVTRFVENFATSAKFKRTCAIC